MSNIFIGLKKTCLGVLDREERGDGNETGLKEGGEIEMSTTVLPLRDAPLSSLDHTYRSLAIFFVFSLSLSFSMYWT